MSYLAVARNPVKLQCSVFNRTMAALTDVTNVNVASGIIPVIENGSGSEAD